MAQPIKGWELLSRPKSPRANEAGPKEREAASSGDQPDGTGDDQNGKQDAEKSGSSDEHQAAVVEPAASNDQTEPPAAEATKPEEPRDERQGEDGKGEDQDEGEGEDERQGEGEEKEPAKELESKFEPKIEGQLDERDWTKESVEDTINNPDSTVSARDTRSRLDGTRRDDPATGYINEDGSYVVRNDVDGTIVQVSDRFDPDWQPPW